MAEMFETDSETREKTQRAFLVGTHSPDEDRRDVAEHLDELAELVKSLGVPSNGSMIIQVREINPRYFVGSGKAKEIGEEAEKAGANVIIFDSALGPSQQRNLERLTWKKVIDRQEVILDIFAERALTREAVLQVKLARYKYFLPRLTGAWSHLSRQRGGSTGARGDGEKQIEYDRRQLRMKIAELEEALAVVRKQRSVQRKSRTRNMIPSVAIVGYTNAGKSSLLNALTGAGVLAEDKLFATLDPVTRKFTAKDKTEFLLTDTVGFVRKLPHDLVEAFKSTLEEAVNADVILLVLDASSRCVEDQWETTLSVLGSLGADKHPIVTVFNKTDLIDDDVSAIRLKNMVPDAVFVSALKRQGLDELAESIKQKIKSHATMHEVVIPPVRADLVAVLHSKAHIVASRYLDDGSFEADVKLPDELERAFACFLKKTNNQTQFSEVYK